MYLHQKLDAQMKTDSLSVKKQQKFYFDLLLAGSGTGIGGGGINFRSCCEEEGDDGDAEGGKKGFFCLFDFSCCTCCRVMGRDRSPYWKMEGVESGCVGFAPDDDEDLCCWF